jgi:hypothetical protein
MLPGGVKPGPDEERDAFQPERISSASDGVGLAARGISKFFAEV